MFWKSCRDTTLLINSKIARCRIRYDLELFKGNPIRLNSHHNNGEG